MRSICLNSVLVFCVLAAQSQEKEAPQRFMFKMSPQHLFQNTLKVGGEFFRKQGSSSMAIFLHAVSNNADKDPYWLFPYNGGGTEIAYRKYISPIQSRTTRKGRTFTQGIYFSVFLQGGIYEGDYDFLDVNYDRDTQTFTEERVIYKESAKNMATGFTIGLQQIYWKTLSLDLYLGAGYQAGQSSITGTPPDDLYTFYKSPLNDAAYTGVLPKGGLMIGIFLK